MQWGPGWGRRLHRGKHGGQPGGGAAGPLDESNEYYVQQAIVAEMERQLQVTCVSVSKVSLDASTLEHLEDFLLEYEASCTR